MTEKKSWTEPELIVITRSKLEEAVLTVCKSNGPGTGPTNNALDCFTSSPCAPCSCHTCS